MSRSPDEKIIDGFYLGCLIHIAVISFAVLVVATIIKVWIN